MPPKPRDPIDQIDDLNTQITKINRDYLALIVAFNHGPVCETDREHLSPFINTLGETIRVALED